MRVEVEKPVAAPGATPARQPSARPTAGTMPTDAQRQRALRRLANDGLTQTFLAPSRRPTAQDPAEIAPRSPEAVLQRVFKYEDVLRNVDLTPHQPEIRDELEDAGADEDVLDSFDTIAAYKASRNFDTWATDQGVDWKPILKTVLGIDVDRERQLELQLFGTQTAKKNYKGGRLEGMSLSGFFPIHPTANTQQLEKVPRTGPGRFDYTVDDDTRMVQLLRQLSTQWFGYLFGKKLLDKLEQEIQTMLAFGNLLIASNNPDTTANLASELTNATGPKNAALYAMLTTPHYKKKALKALSTRHAKKIASFYDEVRYERTDSPQLRQVIQILVAADIHTITDLGDHDAIEEMATTPGRIYILSAPSLTGVSHAEQRLMELRDIASLYLDDPVAWVAGKKRPCFGCWLHETLANKSGDYRLVFQNQPGKAFMNTYRDAHEHERGHWHTTLDDEDFTFYETEGLGGEAGPESDSEADEPLPEYDDAEKLVAAIERTNTRSSHRGTLKRHFEAGGGDYDATETYVRARKKAKVEPKLEEQMATDIDALATWAAKNPNPVLKRRYSLKKRYKPKK